MICINLKYKTMRRLPIYFLVDVSESMVGEPIDQVQNGLRTIIQELRLDPYALETAFVSVIVFAGKATSLSPLTELYKFYPTTFPVGGGTSLGAAIHYLMNDLDKSIQKTTLEVKGDWKPIIFLFTDGTPTDDVTPAFNRWNASYKKSCNLIAISIGDNVNTQMLGQISDNVLRLNDTDSGSFSQFFKWVTASIKATSVSVTDYSDDEVKLAPITGINLEKIDTKQSYLIDENFVVLLGKCQNTKKNYLVKYAKRMKRVEMEGFSGINTRSFKLVGAYPIDGEAYKNLSADGETNCSINTAEMRGVPTCPCCGNQLGVVVCECGNIFCVGDDLHSSCPWCGLEGTLGSTSEGGVDVNRGRG